MKSNQGMSAEILAVGTELLMGQIANTNAQYISRRLPDVGVNVYYHSVVGDNPGRLKECMRIALERSDAVIMTGGLGPTQDDLTKETVAEMMGKSLVLHQESLDKMKRYFEKINRPMVDSNIKQAYLPEGSIIIENNNGTAPGCIIENEGKIVIMLPGPPSEMKPMFEDTVVPYFRSKAEYKIESKFIKVFGVGESSVEAKLIDLIDGQTNPTIATYAKDGEVTLRVSAKCGKEEDPEKIMEPVLKEIESRLGISIYSRNGEEMEEVVGRLLTERKTTVSTAESCTGGMVSGRLTSIPGISEVFLRGFVTYSNEAKIDELGVKRETIAKHGAVSKETAVEMAEGVKKASGTELGLSVTGIAGPGGGTENKPVGLVYIALAGKGDTVYRELHLAGSREKIRNSAVLNALDMIRQYLLTY